MSQIAYWISYSIFAFVGLVTSFGIGKMELSKAFMETQTDKEEKIMMTNPPK
jgi:hypothetical protein